MSSEMFMFENSFFSEPFSPFTNTSFEIPQDSNKNNPFIETTSFDTITSALLSSSPPSVRLEGLSLSELGVGNYTNAEYSVSNEVKTEQCSFNYNGGFATSSFGVCGNSFLPRGCDDESGIAMKFMQRSVSSNCFENKRSFSSSFTPRFDGVAETESRELGNQMLSEMDGSFGSGQMRRVCSTGDLQKMQINMQTRNVLSSSPLSKSYMEEANFKVGRYSAEERKERIDRYKAKRTLRNFNKTIKYACRKTLADNRPRVRGRFARNDEAVEIPKAASMSSNYRYHEDDEFDLWVDGFHEGCEEGLAQPFFNNFGSTQYHNFSYC